MSTDSTARTFQEWLLGTSEQWGALWQWLLLFVIVLLVGNVIGMLLMMARHGPGNGVRAYGRAVGDIVFDLVHTSPRRVFALARLSVYESIRRKVWVVVAVFAVLLMFAGWFLDPGPGNPAVLYLTFVLTSTSYLVLMLALFLSVFSLPQDINKKTIHTVVTKPTRRSEIVLGRILGFTFIGTFVLVLMAIAGAFFVVRGLQHSHEVVASSLKEIEPTAGVVKPENPLVLTGQTTNERGVVGETGEKSGHRHTIFIREDGTGFTDVQKGHWHEVTSVERGGETVYEIGPAQGMLTAKVPIYGDMYFKDSTGTPTERGVNVGKESGYRGYFGGGTLGAGVWEFDNVTPERFPQGLPVEFSVRVERTHKGEIDRKVRGALSVNNPVTDEGVEISLFEVNEYGVPNRIYVPTKLMNPDPEGEPLDLFEDLVVNGKVRIQMRCIDQAQYIGAARKDLFLRAQDASFALNFAKGYVGIWLQMLMVTSLGVLFSTFLSAPVAMLGTIAALIFGFFTQKISLLANNELVGGGPVESFYRLITQKNLTGELPDNAIKAFVETADTAMLPVLQAILSLVPDFSKFNYSNYNDANGIAQGFNIPGQVVAAHTLEAVAYVLPVFIVGYVFLKLREVAR